MAPERFAAALAVAVALATATSAAAAPPRTVPARAATVAALHRAEEVRSGRGVVTGRELTPLLARVSAGLPLLGGDDRLEAEALLARPDDGQADPPDTHKWSGPEDMSSPWCVQHFCIHWAKSGADAPDAMPDSNHNQVPDSIEQMASIFETEVYPCENGAAAGACALTPGAGGAANGLGWREPPPDAGRGGDDRLDVYIEDFFPSGVFGYVAMDPGQSSDPAVPHASYMVMDKDYTRFANGSASGGLADERVTAAHEYNHALQYAYDYLQDGWMLESTAVWMEDEVYPGINDYLQYLPDWVANPGQPLTTFSSVNLKQYGSAVWNHWLDHRFGSSVVRAAWEDSVAAANFAPAAYNAAIGGSGGGGFSDEFGRFVAATAEWDAPGSGFPDAYPDVARSGSLPVGNVTAPFPLAHTAFALFDVPLAAGAPPVIRLLATLPTGTTADVALVGRTGGDPAAGTVTTSFTSIGADGVGAVALNDPAAFGRITAVIANGDATTSGFDPAAGDYVFTHDAPSVLAQVDAPGAPVVTTGAPQGVADHSASVSATVDAHLLDTTWSIEYGKTARYGLRTDPQPIPATTLTAAHVTASLPALSAKRSYHYRVRASNSAGETVGGDGTFTTPADVTPPRLTLTVPRRVTMRAAARGVPVRLRASEACVVTLELSISRRLAKRLGTAPSIAAARVRLATAKTKRVRLKLRGRALHALSGLRRLRASLRAVATDLASNHAQQGRHLTFAR